MGFGCSLLGVVMPRTDYVSSGATDTLVTSAARTTSADSGVLGGWGYASKLRVQLAVTASSGTTPTLDVVLEDTLDGTNWANIGTFTQKTTSGVEVINVVNPFAERIRVRWTIAGTTPSFTFSVIAYSE